MDPAEKHQVGRGSVGLNLIVLLFLGSLTALGVRNLATDDTRFGWGMFSHRTDYWIDYEWLYPDGSTTRVVDTRLDLQGRQSIISGVRHHSTRYGVGAVRRWIGSYLAYLYERRRPEGAAAVRAQLNFLINGAGGSDGKPMTEVLVHPPPHGRT